MDSDHEGGFWNSPRVVGIFADTEPSDAVKNFLLASGYPPGARVLDMGCGGGRNATLVAEMGYDLWACDAHEAMVAATVQRLGVKYVDRVQQANMVDLPYETGFFDAVIANGVLHNAYTRDELVLATQELSRVLSPQGWLFVNCFVLNETTPEEQRIRLVDQERDLYITDDDGLRMTLLSPTGLQDVFTAAGFIELWSELRVGQEFTGPRDFYRAWLAKNFE
jgi:SAM-dependent methyltransferase